MLIPVRFGNLISVSQQNSNTQSDTAVAVLPDGQIAVAWFDFGTNAGDIKHRIISGHGAVQGSEMTANSATAALQSAPAIAALSSNTYAITWETNANSHLDVQFRVFNRDGGAVTNELQARAAPQNQSRPAIANVDNDRFIIAWEDTDQTTNGLTATNSAILAQTFTSSGAAVGVLQTRISGNWGGDGSPAVAALGDLTAFVWDDSLGPTNSKNGEDGIYYRTQLGPMPIPASISSPPYGDGGTRADQGTFRESSNNPDVAINFSGGLGLVWDDAISGTTDSRDIFARFGSAASPLRINLATAGDQEKPAIAALATGGFVVAWTDRGSGFDIRARVFDDNGGPISDEFIVNVGTPVTGTENDVDVASLIDGRFIVTWATGSVGDRGVEAQIFDPRTTPIRWEGQDFPGGQGGVSELFYGTNIAGPGDELFGNLGNDQIFAQHGDDTVNGGGGNDLIYAGAGNDTITGGAGNDVILGEQGQDVILFNDNVLTARIVSDGTRHVVAAPNSGIDVILDGETLLFGNAQWTNTGGPLSPITDNRLSYIASYADLSSVFGLNAAAAFAHFETNGAAEGRGVSFNPFAYLLANADVRAAFGMNAVGATQHFIQFGRAEGRQTDTFDEWSYLASHADLRAAFGVNGVVATEHYARFGAGEGRALDTFNEFRYIASHADLIGAFGGPTVNAVGATQHYAQYGAAEGRQVNFNASAYIARYADLQAAFGTDTNAATLHYIQYGFAEGRTWA